MRKTDYTTLLELTLTLLWWLPRIGVVSVLSGGGDDALWQKQICHVLSHIMKLQFRAVLSYTEWTEQFIQEQDELQLLTNHATIDQDTETKQPAITKPASKLALPTSRFYGYKAQLIDANIVLSSQHIAGRYQSSS